MSARWLVRVSSPVVLAGLLSLFAAGLPAQDKGPPDVRRNARLGMPTDAKPDPSQREDFLIVRPQYCLSYNAKTAGPNWVSWRLIKADIGDAARAAFEPDALLPRGFARITSHAYDGSGYDRGHQCPAKDRSATPGDCAATFVMSNVVPQAPNCNQRGWERLEDYCRRLAHEGRELQIVCGPQGVGGEGKNGTKEEIGKGNQRVAVPARLWKVVVVLPEEGAEPRRNTRVISVVLPNDQSVDYDWAKYRTTAKRIEKLTGYTFFRELPEETAAALREHLDEVEVRTPKGKGEGKPE
jgi:endonuclease G